MVVSATPGAHEASHLPRRRRGGAALPVRPRLKAGRYIAAFRYLWAVIARLQAGLARTRRLRYQALRGGSGSGRSKLHRSCLVLAVLALLSTSPVLGQYSEVIAACRWDSLHVCVSVPGGEEFARCIRVNFQTLTEACKDALVRTVAAGKACGADVAQRCPGIKPGSGRILLCVKAHYAALSEPCKEAMGHAAARER